MFVTDNVNYCTCVISKSMDLTICILCSFDLARQHIAFALLLLFNSMDTLCMYVSVICNYYCYFSGKKAELSAKSRTVC